MRHIKVKRTQDLGYPTHKYFSKAAELAGNFYEGVIKHAFKFDNVAIFCTGTSGLILATLFGNHFKYSEVNLFYMRKPGEDAHCMDEADASYCGFNLREDTLIIFIDDNITSGNTFNKLYDYFKRCENKGNRVREGILNLKIDFVCVSEISLRFHFSDEQRKDIKTLITDI